MAVKMDEFLLEYYKRLIFRAMRIEQFTQYCEYVKADDLAGNMKEWKDLLEKDAAGEFILDGAKNYVRKGLPDPEEAGGDWELSNAEWEKLFKAFQDTFQAMDANKKSFKYDDKANKFLDKYFGTAGQLFTYGRVTGEAETAIAQIGDLLEQHPELRQQLSNFFNDDFSFEDLKNGIRDKKYQKDAKFQEQLKAIAETLHNHTNYYGDESPIFRIIGKKLNLSAVFNNFEDTTINPDKIREFKNVYPDLLKELYTNTKAYDAFKANDRSKISKSIEEAKSRLDYNDKESKSYVPPKREDQLTMPQRISEWWDNTYENYLDKYVKLHGDRMYFSPQAKLIVKAIDKEKIKPTDGLAKVMENASKITDALKKKSNKAKDHFEWFTKTMGELKDTMPKAFAGALQNGTQMRAIIQEIIMKAVRENKIAEAKTAMEVLSVIKYGYTTSKIMDTLGKENLTIFSDSKLSWNKNDGMKFVMTALDKSIKTAFMGIGYGITITGNAIKLSGSKFNGKSQTLVDAHNAQVAEYTAKKDAAKRDRDEKIQQKAYNQETLDNMATNTAFPHGGINDANIAQHRDDFAQSKSQEEQLNMRLAYAHEQQAEIPNKINEIQQQISQNAAAQAQTNNEIVATSNRINWLQSEIANPATPPANLPTYQNELNYLQNAVLPHYTNQLNQLQTQQVSLNRNLTRYQRLHTQMANVITNRENALVQKQRENQRTEIRLNTWADAKDTVQMLDSQITKRDKELDDWDKDHKQQYKELMAYWDFLETGRDTHTGAMYSWTIGNKKAKQKGFDANKAAIFQNYLNGYSMQP